MMIVFTVMLSIIIAGVLEYTAYTMEQKNIQMLESLAHGPVRFGKFEAEANFSIMSVSINQEWEIQKVSGSDFQLSETQIQDIVRQVKDTRKDQGLLAEYDLRFQVDRPPKEDKASKEDKVPQEDKPPKDDKLPSMSRILFADTKPDVSSFRNLVFSCFAFGLLCLLAFFILCLYLARSIVHPVEEAWNQQRQFIADASHELKTPLAVITTNAELLRDEKQDEASRKQYSEHILTTSRQMRQLVEGLLELARVDNGAAKLNFAPIDLTCLAEEAALTFEVLFFEQGLPFRTEIAGNVTINGSQQHIRLVADILLDNARKYTTPGGEVTLALKQQSSHALLSVSGPGEEISPENLKNIFQRFYRIDNTRPRDGSYGLGLPIAQAITEDHGGKIWAESKDGLNTFFVQLPIA